MPNNDTDDIQVVLCSYGDLVIEQDDTNYIHYSVTLFSNDGEPVVGTVGGHSLFDVLLKVYFDIQEIMLYETTG